MVCVELLLCVAKLGRFCRSARSARLRKKEQHYAGSFEILQRYFASRIALQRKIRRFVSNFKHVLTLSLPKVF